jgi:hypothetical protein
LRRCDFSTAVKAKLQSCAEHALDGLRRCKSIS